MKLGFSFTFHIHKPSLQVPHDFPLFEEKAAVLLGQRMLRVCAHHASGDEAFGRGICFVPGFGAWL